MTLRVGSLFSGIGGMDYGLAAAGWEHAFFCEGGGDPDGTESEQEQWKQGVYRRAVLAARWPGVPIYDDVRSLCREAVADSGERGQRDRGSRPDAGRKLRPPSGGGVEPSQDAQRAGGVHTGLRGAAVRGTAGDGASGHAIDLLCGGFPCQDLSVAGRRRGLAGDRSGLFFDFARIIDALRPRWVLIENVPGLLSNNGGRDFGVVLGTLADIGYGVAWRVLDSRFFDVPQRRKRVFIVGALADGDPRAAAGRAGEILAVGARCSRHLATRGEAGPDTPVASLSGLGSGGPDDNDGQQGRLVANTLGTRVRHAHGDGETMVVAAPLTSGGHPNSNAPGRRKEDDENLVAYSLRSNERNTSQGPGNYVTAFLPTGGGAKGLSVEDDLAPGTGTGAGGTVAVAYPLARRGRDGGSELEVGEPGVYNSLRAGDGGSSRLNQVLTPEASVRRLTPTECERLQGLPDGWTDLGDTKDSRRYSAVGDAVTAPVAEWIGRRLMSA